MRGVRRETWLDSTPSPDPTRPHCLHTAANGPTRHTPRGFVAVPCRRSSPFLHATTATRPADGRRHNASKATTKIQQRIHQSRKSTHNALNGAGVLSVSRLPVLYMTRAQCPCVRLEVELGASPLGPSIYTDHPIFTNPRESGVALRRAHLDRTATPRLFCCQCPESITRITTLCHTQLNQAFPQQPLSPTRDHDASYP